MLVPKKHLYEHRSFYITAQKKKKKKKKLLQYF